MKGKDKCEFLKGIRKRMAEANGIPYEPRECTFEGECTGTCPFCEKEAAELMAKLRKKEAEGVEIDTDIFSIEAIEAMHKDPGSIPFHLWDSMVTPGICSELYEERKREWEERERKRIIEEQDSSLKGDIPSLEEETHLKAEEESRRRQQEKDCTDEEKRKGGFSNIIDQIKRVATQGLIEDEE